MRVLIVTPAPRASHNGNRVTAERWRDLLRDLGHDVTVSEDYLGQGVDVLVALHARRSEGAVHRFRTDRPRAPLVVALTGTDLYPDLATSGVPAHVLEAADRLVVLQPLGLLQLPAEMREKARVIVQSATPVAGPRPREDTFEVVQLAHLRSVKDPLLLAAATRLVPEESRLRALHLGAMLDDELGSAAAHESATNPRYSWLGDLPRREAMTTLAGARLLVLTSRHEGGANAVSEALASKVPVVSTRVDGSVGLLGADYPGYVPVGDATALAELLWRLERDESGCYRDLSARCAALRPLVDPARERASWADLLAGVSPTAAASGSHLKHRGG